MKSNFLVVTVEDNPKSLKEIHAGDESEVIVVASVAKFTNSQINHTFNTTNVSVMNSRPDLSARVEIEGNLIKKKKKKRNEYDSIVLLNDA